MCSVNSFGLTARPASSNATFSPASESCLAAHPPVAPDPTTTASYVCSRGSLSKYAQVICVSLRNVHILDRRHALARRPIPTLSRQSANCNTPCQCAASDVESVRDPRRVLQPHRSNHCCRSERPARATNRPDPRAPDTETLPCIAECFPRPSNRDCSKTLSAIRGVRQPAADQCTGSPTLLLRPECRSQG